ncbi:MAG: spore coat associated protein CotJA [Clostridia bacterium]|nr:spore coat associated protein CotJA [Clostridia bacterium]
MTSFPEDYVLAMAYVPFQSFNETYDAEKALCQGTLFPCLDKPFVGC